VAQAASNGLQEGQDDTQQPGWMRQQIASKREKPGESRNKGSMLEQKALPSFRQAMQI